MSVATRADVVSSFTIIKGTMIEETYAVFDCWDFGRPKENLDRLRADNYIGATSTTWLRDVAKVLNRRFEPAARDRALVILAQGRCSLRDWTPLLLWHMTRDEFLLRDFLANWLYPLYEGGAFRVRPEELDGYLHDIRSQAVSPSTSGQMRLSGEWPQDSSGRPSTSTSSRGRSWRPELSPAGC